MTYVLDAFFARTGVFDANVTTLPGAVLVTLPQGFVMLPNVQVFQEGFGTIEHDPTSEPIFYYLHPAMETLFAEQSRKGMIAYVEIELFGGSGPRAAVIWQDGQTIFGPLSSEDNDPVKPALKRLGVLSTGHIDEFAALGLGRYRWTEDWIGPLQTVATDPILKYTVTSPDQDPARRSRINQHYERLAAMPGIQKEVDDFMARLDYPLKAEVEALRTIIKAVDPRITELIKWNAPSYHYLDYIATFNLHDPKQIRLIFHNPAIASIASPILEGNYVDRRIVYFASMDDVMSKQAEVEKVVSTLIQLMEQSNA